MSEPTLGDSVEVHFWDHCEGAAEPIAFIAYGRLARMNEQVLVVESWTYPNPCDSRDNPQNITRFAIVRPAVIAIFRLRRARQSSA